MANTFDVGLFFYIDGAFKIHGCSLEQGENYGDFVVYPYSHMKLWDKYHAKEHKVDFDYYPRGRVVYRKTDDTYIVYYDRCVEEVIKARIEERLKAGTENTGKKVIYETDEHYQCHKCNRDYVM